MLLLYSKKLKGAHQIGRLAEPIIDMFYLANVNARETGAENRIYQIRHHSLPVIIVDDHLVESLKIIEIIAQKCPELIGEPAFYRKLARVFLLAHYKTTFVFRQGDRAVSGAAPLLAGLPLATALPYTICFYQAWNSQTIVFVKEPLLVPN